MPKRKYTFPHLEIFQMFTRTGIAAVIILSLVVNTAFAEQVRPLPPLPMPDIKKGVDDPWREGVLECFDQANKRRGPVWIDVKPQFTNVDDGRTYDMPPFGAHVTCFVKGSKEVRAEKAGT